MTPESPQPSPSDEGQKYVHPGVEFGLVLLALALAVGAIYHLVNKWRDTDAETVVEGEGPQPEAAAVPRTKGPWGLAALPTRNVKLTGFHNFWDPERDITLWFDEVPLSIQTNSVSTAEDSNIRPVDYAGADSCRECHAENHAQWMGHSHRLMNALAVPENMLGDFSGQATIDYVGGTGRFYQQAGRYRMALKRDSITRIYEIERTIGSRFFQYYIGRLVEGSEAADSPLWTTQHVLPFGYWIDEKQWVPTVHVFRESNTDRENQDPYTESEIVAYDSSCTACHVTFAGGDWILNLAGGRRLSVFSPRPVGFHIHGYLNETRPNVLGGRAASEEITNDQIFDIAQAMGEMPAIQHSMALGIACEACHFGSKKHVEQSTKTTSGYLPKFFPAGPHVFARGKDRDEVLGRNDHNLNFTCAKCHSGGRPEYANGNHTWNSTEYSDAVRGFCYDPGRAKHAAKNFLTCVHCHDPHEATGRKWQRTPAQDDQSCISCHTRFEKPAAITAHTHHQAGGGGSRCLNCHMPKITEGLQDMIRTHRIFNPTEPRMIEANQVNACNLCHLEKPIDWTIDHLRSWYGDEHKYDGRKLTSNYPNRTGPVALGWLRGAHAPTRLSAAEALARSDQAWALPHLLDLLIEDDNLVHRQFTQKRLEEKLNYDFDTNGYSFYMTIPQRKAAIEKIRPQILGRQAAVE